MSAVLSNSPFQVTIWQPGHSYNPGDVVQPTTQINAGSSPPTNPDFVASLAGWTASAHFVWSAAPSYNSTGGSAAVTAGQVGQTLVNNNQVAVTVGQTINANFYAGGNSSIGIAANVIATPQLLWYDNTHALIHTTNGAPVNVGAVAGITWWNCKVSDSAPSGAAYCAVGVSVDNPSGQVVYVDTFYWDYIIPQSGSTTPVAAYFTSISSGVAVSGSAEPDWSNGGTNVGNVVDGGITWARGLQEVIQWAAYPFCKSDAITEPTWPLTVGGSVRENTGVSAFDWICRSLQVLDSNCPQSRYVAISASHIFAGDNDITRFCAVTNPLDWTSEDDAGFLANGLQNYGSTPVTAIDIYRGNLAIFNSESLQLWQMDQDPALMSLLDVIPVGCTWPRALTSVNDDLFFLSSQGVRSVTNSVGTANLESGDVGMPIDPIIQAGAAWATTNNVQPMAIYVPSAGQFWIVFPGWNQTSDPTKYGSFFYPETGAYATGDTVFVYTRAKTGDIGAWSYYTFPYGIESWCIHSGSLYLHTAAGAIGVVDINALTDFTGLGSGTSNFVGVVQWPYLDFGQTGTTKFLHTIDVALSDNTAMLVQVGFDQSAQANPLSWTTVFEIPGDSFPGMQIPVPCAGPSFSIRLIMNSQDGWQVDAVNAFVSDAAVTS